MQLFLRFEGDLTMYFEGDLLHALERSLEDEHFLYAYWQSGLAWVVVDRASAEQLLKSGSCSALVYDAPPTYPTAKLLETTELKAEELK